jgi:hypothetical protein
MADTNEPFCLTGDMPDSDEQTTQKMCGDITMRFMDEIANNFGPAAAMSGMTTALINFMVHYMTEEGALGIISQLPEGYRVSQQFHKDAARRAAN